ncbi:hypothetical protein FHS27_004436 [Rhodopirellula rubra]|uniref:Uncharacterized protein n=1 Tax=Aporhodopirellula rubra TaxID=980271 RepID=A0A7W5E1R7_9BACT|nr:hypothetical protein [Aporhodopirellula rubra]MBB3208604.1 hypothetical protein [Aporhodopirellula rubra]
MITLAEIRSNATVVEDLDWPFDFSLDRADDDTDWIQLKQAQPFTVIAGEGTGGVFLSCGLSSAAESLPILHGTSEGQAGRVASNLTEWLAILMAVPYWRDLLKFSAGGQLDEMRKTATFMDKEYAEDFADLPDARERILALLPIPTLDDPIKVLHDNVHATDCVLVAEDGYEYESLFNKFRPSDNRNWC